MSERESVDVDTMAQEIAEQVISYTLNGRRDRVREHIQDRLQIVIRRLEQEMDSAQEQASRVLSATENDLVMVGNLEAEVRALRASLAQAEAEKEREIERWRAERNTWKGHARDKEARVRVLEEALRLDKPWPLVDVLGQFHRLVAHLLDHHDCDVDQWESIKAASAASREIIAALAAPQGPEGSEPPKARRCTTVIAPSVDSGAIMVCAGFKDYPHRCGVYVRLEAHDWTPESEAPRCENKDCEAYGEPIPHSEYATEPEPAPPPKEPAVCARDCGLPHRHLITACAPLSAKPEPSTAESLPCLHPLEDDKHGALLCGNPVPCAAHASPEGAGK